MRAPFLAVSLAALAVAVGGSCPAAQGDPPAGSPSDATPVAKPADVAAQWESLHPDAIGNVRPLLVGGTARHPVPVKRFPWDKNALRAPMAFVIVPELRSMAVLDVRPPNMELRTMDLETGKLSEPLATIPGVGQSLHMIAGPDGKSVIVRAAADQPIEIYDLKTRERKATIPVSGLSKEFLVADGSTLVVVAGDDEIQRWDLQTGTSKGTARIKFELKGKIVVPLACTDGVLLVGVIAEDDSPASTPSLLMAVELTTGEVKAKTELLRSPVVACDGCQSVVMASLAEEGSGLGMGCASLNVLKVASLEKIATPEMRPVISVLQAMLFRNGATLATIEYMVNVIVIWDTKTGTPLAALPPEVGGSVDFQVTPDGSTLVSFGGPFVNGSIRPEHWEVYDLKSLFAQPVPATPPVPAK